MSPEQACGDKSIDARSDQYSLAVVGYRMLSGTLPFDGESTRAVLYQQLVGEPKPLGERMPDLPGPINVAIQRAMAKEPNERFPSMREFAAMLEGDSSLTLTPKPGPGITPGKAASSRRTSILMGVVAALAMVGWYFSQGSPAQTTTDETLVPSAVGTPEPTASGAALGAATTPIRIDVRRDDAALPGAIPGPGFGARVRLLSPSSMAANSRIDGKRSFGSFAMAR